MNAFTSPLLNRGRGNSKSKAQPNLIDHFKRLSKSYVGYSPKQLDKHMIDSLPTETKFYTYSAFGLVISSPLQCPELTCAVGPAHVKIEFRKIAAGFDSPKTASVRFKANPQQLLLEVDGVARFLIQNGSEIVIDRIEGASDECVRLFLLGSAFGALLHQRGTLVLHGSAIAVGQECVMFIGYSGAGKSTLAAALRSRGHGCLSDDLCAIELNENGVPHVLPAYPQAKLWLDSLDQLNVDYESLRRVRPKIEKRAVRFEEGFPRHPLPIKKCYVLTPLRTREDIALRPVLGSVKIRVLRDNTYRLQFLEGLECGVEHFKQIAAIAQRVPITRILRPERPFLLNELVDAVERDLES